jgi:hypothetical protein
MAGDVIATPIYMQLIVTALLGGIIYFFSLRGKNVLEKLKISKSLGL